MGQKVHPYGFRLGIHEDWKSHWFAKKDYGKEFLEDVRIRKFLGKHLGTSEVSKIVVDKAGENIRVIVHSSRPGLVIGKKGQEIDSLRTTLAARFKKSSVEISVKEVKTPELDALLLAKSIAGQLVRRVSYKKAMKKACALAMKSGAKGIKICCAGRLNGAEIARKEWARLGSIPLHTLRSDVDYGFATAKTTYGIIGVKVWICRGDYQYNSLS